MPSGVYERTKEYCKRLRDSMEKAHKRKKFGFQKGCNPTSGCFKKGRLAPNWNGFKKGHKPVAPFKKGIRNNPKGEFKKGHIAWNTNKKCPQLSGKNNGNYKRGKRKCGEYIEILKTEHPFCNNGYVLEHRLVIEQQIDRYLLSNEESHHINGIKNDNRPENLMAFMSHSAHFRFHGNPNNVKPKEIIFDGRKVYANN